MKYLFLSLILTLSLYAKEYIYFLPNDSKKALDHIEKLIESSKSSIDIAMYNLEYKKLIKLLKKAKSNGVDVNIVYEKGDKLKEFDTKKTDSKMHTKIAIFDKKVVVFGSANWTKQSFKENYEVIYISDEKDLVEKFNRFFQRLIHQPL